MEIEGIKILEKEEDYMDWDKLINHCETINNLTELEREKAKRAFVFLRKEFGEDFLKNAFTDHHPIVQYIINLAPWTRRWIIWFAESIKELKEQENYPSLLEKLKDNEKFEEGLSILDIAYKFSKAGFNISFDPVINVSERKKIPDLKLIDRNVKEELFVEVAGLGESKIARDASETMQRIIEPLLRYVPFMHLCGRIHKTLSKKHLEDIVYKIEKIIEKSKTEDIFQELSIEGVIELAIAPQNDKHILEKWATERGLKVGEFYGPPFNVDEIHRTRRKIESEQKQLPGDYPNILIISNNNLFFYLSDVEKAIRELEEAVYDYTHLLAVVVAGGYMGRCNGIFKMVDEHIYIEKTTIDLFVDRYILLLNKYCEKKISPATITKMYKAFTSY